MNKTSNFNLPLSVAGLKQLRNSFVKAMQIIDLNMGGGGGGGGGIPALPRIIEVNLEGATEYNADPDWFSQPSIIRLQNGSEPDGLMVIFGEDCLTERGHPIKVINEINNYAYYEFSGPTTTFGGAYLNVMNWGIVTITPLNYYQWMAEYSAPNQPTEV